MIFISTVILWTEESRIRISGWKRFSSKYHLSARCISFLILRITNLVLSQQNVIKVRYWYIQFIIHNLASKKKQRVRSWIVILAYIILRCILCSSHFWDNIFLFHRVIIFYVWMNLHKILLWRSPFMRFVRKHIFQ